MFYSEPRGNSITKLLIPLFQCDHRPNLLFHLYDYVLLSTSVRPGLDSSVSGIRGPFLSLPHFTSLNMAAWGPTHMVVDSRTGPPLWLAVCHLGSSGYFHFLALLNPDPVSTGTWTSLWQPDFSSFAYISSSEISGSHGCFIVNSFRQTSYCFL